MTVTQIGLNHVGFDGSCQACPFILLHLLLAPLKGRRQFKRQTESEMAETVEKPAAFIKINEISAGNSIIRWIEHEQKKSSFARSD
jgi:hypothetical protein